MKLNKTNLRKLKSTASPLGKYVLNWCIEHIDNYTDKYDMFNDVIFNGCASGIVSDLVFYCDIEAFLRKFRPEIIHMLYNAMENEGIMNISDFFWNWYTIDPLCQYLHNKCILAWWAFETKLQEIADNFYYVEVL